MKTPHFLAWTVLLVSVLQSPALGETDELHQWVRFGSPQAAQYCDLAQTGHLTIAGDRVVAETSFPSPTGTTTAYQLFEDNATVAQLVLKAAQDAPARWIRVESYSSEIVEFINLREIASILFGSDEKGAFARLVPRFESIMRRDVVAKYPTPGYLIRNAADVARLPRALGLP